MIKHGVRLHGIIPQMFLAYDTYKDLCKEYGVPYAITSGIEGSHKRNSQHWGGRALDFRTWNNNGQWDNKFRTEFCLELRKRLGDEFVVIGEPDHIHCHYSPLKAS